MHANAKYIDAVVCGGKSRAGCATMAEDHVECPTCGVTLTSLLCPSSKCSDTDSETPAPKPRKKIKKARLRPSVLRMLAARRLVSISMLCCIPGITRKKAGAMLDAFPSRALIEVAHATNRELASIRVGKAENARLGSELARAVQRVLIGKVH